MFIPRIPVVPHTTVKNKTIVYNDTVLPLKDLGNNLKVCTISDVSEYSLESCLKKIFEANPDVIFNTIQYSKNDKKVYFYTDKNISTKIWEESKVIKYKPLNSATEILEEFKKVFSSDKNKDTECISLYEILKLIKSRKIQYDEMEESYKSELKNAIDMKYNHAYISIIGFNYRSDELMILFKRYVDCNEICFSKNNGDLFITKSETYHDKNVLAILGNILSNAYDDYKKYGDFKNQYKYALKSVNSNFLVDIKDNKVIIYSERASDFELSSYLKLLPYDYETSSYDYKNKYDYDCNSNTVISAIRGKEDELFKRIFIRIDDCPEWSKQSLYQIRQEQLKEEKRLEEEQLNIEIKRQKILALKRKIFPWMKK